jgi:hypothetical protein
VIRSEDRRRVWALRSSAAPQQPTDPAPISTATGPLSRSSRRTARPAGPLTRRPPVDFGVSLLGGVAQHAQTSDPGKTAGSDNAAPPSAQAHAEHLIAQSLGLARRVDDLTESPQWGAVRFPSDRPAAASAGRNEKGEHTQRALGRRSCGTRAGTFAGAQLRKGVPSLKDRARRCH